MNFKQSIRMGHNGDSECGVVVGARLDYLTITETDFYHPTISRVHRDLS